MKLNEDNEIKNITKMFSTSVSHFNKRDYQKAFDGFEEIIKKYEDSEFYSVLEIQTRSKTYRNICKENLDTKQYKPESNEEYINEVVYNINAENFDEALKFIEQLKKKKYDAAYLDYLQSVLYIKQGDTENSLKFLAKCVEKDDDYKVLANNEPDFESLLEDEIFNQIIE
ncbi:MAG: tetratricopeptide repeat protein [Acidobacteriota bacterium]